MSPGNNPPSRRIEGSLSRWANGPLELLPRRPQGSGVAPLVLEEKGRTPGPKGMPSFGPQGRKDKRNPRRPPRNWRKIVCLAKEGEPKKGRMRLDPPGANGSCRLVPGEFPSGPGPTNCPALSLAGVDGPRRNWPCPDRCRVLQRTSG